MQHDFAAVGASRLSRRSLITIFDREGERVECLGGSLWITQDGDPRDVVLEAGEHFTLDRAGKAIVYALADSWLAILPQASQTPSLDDARRRGAPLSDGDVRRLAPQRSSA